MALHAHRCEITLLIALLFVAVGVRLPGLFSRAIWYDEAITLLETAGYATPTWPREPEPAYKAKRQFEGTPDLSKITEDLRRTDIHPPVYYWSLSLWRRWLGFSLETARAFSLLCSLGTIVALYGLLRVGNLQYPLLCTLVYSISTSAVHFGHEARAYALASLLITTGALFAYLAYEVSPRNKKHATAYTITMALCCGLAFQTNYLAIFPVGFILLWFFVNLWPVSRSIAILSILISVSIGTVGISTLLMQLSARPHQANFFGGLISEAIRLLKITLGVIWIPPFDPRFISESETLNLWMYRGVMMVYGGLVVLMGGTLAYVFRHWSKTNRSLWTLLLGLAATPSLGLILLALIFHKHMHQTRYLTFAGPALAVVATYGIMMLISTRRRLGMFLLIILLGLQIVGINWGFEEGHWGQGKSTLRSLASTIKISSLPSHIMVIGEGAGRGYPGALIYELEPHTMIAVLGSDSDLEALQSKVQDYDDIWIAFSTDSETVDIENDFLNRLQKSGHYTEIFRKQKVFRGQPAVHLRKVKHQ